MTQIPTALNKLSPEEKRAFLAKLLRERKATEHADYRPSHGQQALWFMHKLAPESTVYNVTTAWKIASLLDRTALRRSFEMVVDRHAVLRTTYASNGPDLVQRVQVKLDTHFEEIDAGGLDDRALRNHMTALASEPFDLVNGPIMRVYLFCRGEADHVLLIVIHHIACDMWSVELLMKDLRALYLAETSGQEARLAPLTHQYVDFARWQDELLASEEGDRMWRYWCDRLDGQHPVLELPYDRPRPAVQTFSGDAFKFTFDPVLVDRLRVLASDAGTTLFTVLLSTFQVLLSRYTQQERIPVGSPLLGRSRPEFRELVGYFVNSVVLVADLDGDLTFRALLVQSRQTVLDALDYQDYPFSDLVERLQPARDPSRLPFTDVYFVWDRLQKDDAGMDAVAEEGEARLSLDWGDIKLESVSLSQVGTPSDLAMLILEVGDVLSANLGYNTDLFDSDTIAVMSEHYLRLLESVGANPDARVSELRMLSDDELEQLAICADEPSTEPQRVWSRESETLHGSFARQVERNPDAVAVSCGSDRITYGELDARARQLARRLEQIGVELNSPVAVCVDRSIALIVGIIGILKAGAAYLPLDRSNPPDRLQFMLEDSKATAVVTLGPVSEWLEPGARPVVDLGELWSSREEQVSAKSASAGGDALAYIIYTSGSTGRPKGVEVDHANVLSLLEASQSYFAFDENDVWTLFHSAAFDFSVWEIFGALLFGGRLVIVPFGVSRDPRAFHDLLGQEGVTILNQTPSAFLPLIGADQRAEALPMLRWIIFGGEALDPQSLRPWVERYGDERPGLVNMYGITETTVHVTFRRVRRPDMGKSSASVIGRPLPHLHAYVLGSQMEPLPNGIPGELYIGGDGLARGYVRRPELTAERFVPNPFPGGQGGRLYRTGDLARRLPEGGLEYLGRIDQQVKIRGFRIETGEISAVVAEHPNVQECATIVREDAPGDRRLVSYVVISENKDELQRELLELTRLRLPDYMVPSAFVVIDRLPLTANGKLDPKALPVPDREGRLSGAVHVPARTPVEEVLVEIWEELLRAEDVGVYDNFFELGGHSILVTQMVDRLREAFGVEISIASLFESPTVAELGQEIQILQVSSASPSHDRDNYDEREEFTL